MKKLLEMLKGRKQLPTVGGLVSSFTKQFQEVADENERIAKTQIALIRMAEIVLDEAETEKKLALNFIKNFEKLAE